VPDIGTTRIQTVPCPACGRYDLRVTMVASAKPTLALVGSAKPVDGAYVDIKVRARAVRCDHCGYETDASR
jgi:transcription elongation factor Elf1